MLVIGDWGRWRGGEMGRWGDGEVGRWGEWGECEESIIKNN